MSDIGDVLKLAEVLNARKESDKDFSDLLGEISTTLADILAAMEKPKAEAQEAEAMGKAIAAAIQAGLQQMRPPVVNVPSAAPPTVNVEANAWTSLKVEVDKGKFGTGPLQGFTITKLK